MWDWDRDLGGDLGSTSTWPSWSPREEHGLSHGAAVRSRVEDGDSGRQAL